MAERDQEVAAFVRDLRSPDAPTRFAAVACLGGLRAPEAVESLTRIIGDTSEDELIRLRAIVALGEIGPAAPAAVKTIVKYHAVLDATDFCVEALKTLVPRMHSRSLNA